MPRVESGTTGIEYIFPMDRGPVASEKLLKTALWLAGITVFYNIGEGVVSVLFGLSDKTLSLFGFGLDSFVEVFSGLGIWQMVVRTRKNAGNNGSFQKPALRITGISFYILAIGLAITAVLNVINQSGPSTTVWGIVVAVISIATMLFLMNAKMKVGRRLGNDAIIADANCTKTCVYLSIILLMSSVTFEIFKVGYVDAIGALGIAWYAYKEGRESMVKSRGGKCDCSSERNGKEKQC
jgi:divalent metal cation (Fe/Co/Zn/Cd) transporter